MARQRPYYSQRLHNSPTARLDLALSRRLFREVYLRFLEKGYFDEAFGYSCVDAGPVSGTLGSDLEAQIFLRLRKENLWPIPEKCLEYSEDDLFDVIEFLFDIASKPVKGYHHDYNSCGWHWTMFNLGTGQEEFRLEINSVLRDYGDGFELSPEGEVLVLAESGLSPLLQADLPGVEPDKIEARVLAATQKFRRSRSSLEDRRDALRDLADVLEYLRPRLKEVLESKDEADLFNLANNFGVRHHNEKQKTGYDRSVWYSWIFYYYLATIHAAVRLIEKRAGSTTQERAADAHPSAGYGA